MMTRALVLCVLSLTAGAAAADAIPDFRYLVRQNQAAVVNVGTRQTLLESLAQESLGNKDDTETAPEYIADNERLLLALFRRFLNDMLEPTLETTVYPLGSGFIISTDGYILTGAHVVATAENIVVRLSDGRERQAALIGLDQRTDIAVLKIDADRLSAVRLGDAGRLEVGEWVIAIGSPFGLDNTATLGIVSGVGRSLSDGGEVPLIQTDAAINPGNSGGPLFNVNGEVVGINTRIFSYTGGYMGLSFATPINTALAITEQLKARRDAARANAGLLLQPLTAELAAAFGLENARGALVTEALSDSRGARAGVRSGDIIISADGKPLSRPSQLARRAIEAAPDRPLTLGLLRQGKALTVRLAPAVDGSEPDLTGPAVPRSDQVLLRLGLGVGEREQVAVNSARAGEPRGVIVTVLEIGAARQAGLELNDVIIALNWQEISGVEQFIRLLTQLPRGQPLPLLVRRQGESLYLALTLPG